jgi:putative ATPase
LIERIGLPEARITLGQLATYLALAPKSNAAYRAIDAAMRDAREGRTIPVPLFLRDPNTSPGSAEDGSGQTLRQRRAADASARYQYSHDAEGKVTGQDYLGVEQTYYTPTDEGFERELAQRLRAVRALRENRRP